MSALPNPLQELAEKLRKLRYTVPPCAAPASWKQGETITITAYSAGSEAPLLTEQQIAVLASEFGTLLQAERAALMDKVHAELRKHLEIAAVELNGGEHKNFIEHFVLPCVLGTVQRMAPALSSALSGLLQAERAAVIAQADAAFDSYEGSKLLGAANNVREAIKALATPEAASALAAVVQRETEKLRELLLRVGQARHLRHVVLLNREIPWDSCPDDYCTEIRAALQ